VDEGLALIESGTALDGALLDVNVAGVKIFPIAEALAARDIPFVFSTGYGEGGLPDEWKGRPTLQKPFSEAAVHEAFLVHAATYTDLIKQVGRALLQHARAYAAQHIVLAALLNHDGMDAGLMKQLAQQMPRGAAAHNGYLYAHGVSVNFSGNVPMQEGYAAACAAPSPWRQLCTMSGSLVR
jgi:hypothetical protein